MSLYPSIPHDFGLCTPKDFLLDRNLPAIVVNGIHSMTELVLKKNVFEFNSECFLQISGTAIGTKMAPAYASIVMSIFERKLLTGSCYKPLVWFRYIDDIFATWKYGEDKLKILCFTLILSTHLFSLLVIILRIVFSFWMSQFMWTILVTLRQICMSNLLTRTNI